MEHVLTAELTAEAIAKLDDEARAMLRFEMAETLMAAAMDAGGVDAAEFTFRFKSDGSAAVIVDGEEQVYSLADLASMYAAMMADEPAEKTGKAPEEKPAPEAPAKSEGAAA